MNQLKYNFSDYNLNIATFISKEQFKIYSQFINKLSPLKNIIQTYKMTQNQYIELQAVPRIIENLPILGEEGYDLAIQKTTIYIILNRMFIDNCKNLAIQLNDLNLNDPINSCDKTKCEENLHVLRNYANHATIPISGLTTESSSNGEAKIRPTIKRQDLKGKFNKHDRLIINTWPKNGIEIMPEITKSNTIIQKLLKAIIQKFIKTRINEEEIEQIKADKEIWKNILIPQKTRGVFPLPLSNELKVAYTDSLLLKMVVSLIIDNVEYN